MKSKYSILMVLILILLTSCNGHQNKNKSSLEFYASRYDETGGEWIIDQKPLFTGDDILEYDWETHIIIFKDEFLTARNHENAKINDILKGSAILDLYYPDQLVMILNGNELYTAYVEPQLYISFFPEGPMIKDVQNGILIDCFNAELDTRNNKSLKSFLTETELIRSNTTK